MARPEDLRNEYLETYSFARSLGGWRLATLSFFFIFVGTILRGIWETQTQESDFFSLNIIRLFIPAGGMVGTLLIILVDTRLSQLYDFATNRLFDLERILDVSDGLFSRMARTRGVFEIRTIARTLYILAIVCFLGATILEAIWQIS